MKSLAKLYPILSIILPLFISFSTFAVADTDLTTLVQNALTANSATAQSNIKVTTTNGVVALTGNLMSSEEAENAIKIANSFPGVADVNVTDLTINNAAIPSDTNIVAKVEGLFIREKLFGEAEVNVNTIKVAARNGVVSLSGMADSQVEIDKAIGIAKKVAGVTDVQSTITLK